MKICVYVHSLTGGGVERVAAILATELSQRGHEITLLVDHDRKENQAYLGSLVKFIVLTGRSRSARLLALAKHFATVPYDVVHTMTPALTLITLIARALSRRQFHIVGAYHGTFGPTEGILGNLSFLLTPILTRAADRTVCVSNWLKDYLQHRWYAKPECLVTIYNPVFFGTRRSTAPLKAITDEDYVLYVSRLIEAKDPLLAIDSFALLPERHSNCKLVILGDGPYRSKMRARADELAIGDRVIFVGYVPDPWEFYRRAKVFILTSKLETFSMVLVEAMAHGVPVVAIDRGAPREILAGGRYGALVPVGDIRAFAGAIEAALDTPPPSELLKARAADFKIGAAVDGYERLFEQVISRGG
jgi:glycosyltransferase involved in cell wall biosynthesis